MSDIISSNYASGLTPYSNNGLLLYIHTDGSVYADLTSIAQMVGMSQGAIYSYVVKTCDWKTLAFEHKAGSERGFQLIGLYPISVLKACAKKYNPDLLERFSDAGATMYLYQLAGYKVAVEVKPDLPKTQRELMGAHIELSNKYTAALQAHIDLLDNVEANAGTAHKVMNPCEADGDLYAIEDLFELRGLEVPSLTVKQNIARRLKAVVQNDTLAHTGKKAKTYTDNKGNKHQYAVIGFSRSSLPAFDNECKVYNLI